MTEPARVIHVLRDDHGGHVGGDLVQLGATVDGLRRLGIDAVAATIAGGPAAVDVVHLYNLQRPLALRRDLRAARTRWPNAAIVLSPVWWPMSLARMARTRDRSLVLKAIKTALKHVAWWPVLRHVLRDVDLVLPNSRAEVDALRRSFRLRRSDDRRSGEDARWEVIPNGLHLAEWPFERATASERRIVLRELGVDPDASPVVACVARVEPVKNQLAIIEALDQVPGAALVLVGPDGEEHYADEARAAADTDDRRGRIVFAGRRARDEVRRILTAVDIHVLASYRETPGLATLEAAATGCALVVTDDGSAPEYLGDTAHLARADDPASIAAAIRAATADPRQPAARTAVERYDWSAAVDVLARAYARLDSWPGATLS